LGKAGQGAAVAEKAQSRPASMADTKSNMHEDRIQLIWNRIRINHMWLRRLSGDLNRLLKKPESLASSFDKLRMR
jgi:hypothetical protein